MQVNEFKWRHFQGEIILWAVRWYCKYGISYRELEEMMQERGVEVDHTTLYRWVQSYAPELNKRIAWRTRSFSSSWHVDETYIKIKGQWRYLYRAIDGQGKTIDFYLSRTRNAKAAKCFFGKLLTKRKEWEMPAVIHTDKAGCYSQAIRSLKKEGKLPETTEHRQIKYLNNRIEADHGKLKRLIKPTLGFKTMKTAYATLKGFEAMWSLKKGQASAYQVQSGILGEVRLVERCFHLGASAIEEAFNLIKESFQKQALCLSA